MRRFLALIAVIALIGVPAVALAGEYESYKDVFPDVTYWGSAGTIPWEVPWYEIGDDGNPGSGAVHVWTDEYCKDYKCVHIEVEGGAGTYGVKRYADLSMFETAEICFDVAVWIAEQGFTTGSFDVEVTRDGSKWVVVDSYELADLAERKVHGQVDISDWLSEGFGVRFVVTGGLAGEAFLDNVEIKGTVAGGSTTTTTTSTTSTSSSTTSTTEPDPPTTEPPRTTTSTSVEDTTTTTSPTTSTTRGADEDNITTTTTTTVVPVAAEERPPDSGLRQSDTGVQASFSSDLFGDMAMGDTEVMGVSIDADYSMAVEAISASWVWTVALLLVIVTAIVSGLDRRRSDSRTPTP